MIGLMFLGAIGLWGIIAIALSLWASKLAGAKWRWLAALVLMPLVFFAPVADEIVAYPQMQALCDKGGYELAMDEQSAQGRTIYNDSHLEKIQLWPTVVAQRMRILYVDASTKQPVIQGYGFVDPAYGFLGVPAGSSGGKMTLLLKTCSSKSTEPRDANRIPIRFQHLNFTVIKKS
jgi:hypothetical protein